jgi:hypothetical protein
MEGIRVGNRLGEDWLVEERILESLHAPAPAASKHDAVHCCHHDLYMPTSMPLHDALLACYIDLYYKCVVEVLSLTN